MIELDQIKIDDTTRSNIDQWLNGEIDEATRQDILHMAQHDNEALINSFYTRLSFGTGGLRGIMGPGTNRINRYTIRASTQGLANYLIETLPEDDLKVFISYDNRNNSQTFAMESAKVLAANGIKAYLTKELRPTPIVSFGCRHFNCNAAIMVTASHNPKEYNGYKVYWSDGSQVTPPHDKGIITKVNAITDMTRIKVATENNPLITLVGTELDDAYITSIARLQTIPSLAKKRGKELSVVFSALHGTGTTMVPKTLLSWGFSNLEQIESQALPDGEFSTVISPNPEEKEALSLGIKRLLDLKADLLCATDPDADRVGVAVYHNEKAVLLTGNQIASLCLYHICTHTQLPENAAFAKTIVTTELFRKICDQYQKTCFDTLPGFKYIAEKIREWEESGEYSFVFGGEESYGYLLGNIVRDKDAVICCALLCEAALSAKIEGKTLIDRLHELYETYGVHRESLISVHFPESRQGHHEMTLAMKNLRSDPPTSLDGKEIIAIDDYLKSTHVDLKNRKQKTLTLPQSNVLVFWLSDGKAVVRPSGTEPKIKIYAGVTGNTISECDTSSTNILYDLKERLMGKDSDSS